MGAGVHRLLGVDRVAPRWPTDQSDFAFVDCSRHRCVETLEAQMKRWQEAILWALAFVGLVAVAYTLLLHWLL